MAIVTDTPTTHPQPPEPSAPGPHKSPRALIAISVVVILAAVAAVAYAVTSGGSGKPTAVTGTTAPSVTVTQPTAPAVTTPSTVLGPSGDPATWPAAQGNPPSLASLYTSPPDFVAIVKTLQSYIDWVYTHPDTSLVANYMLPDSSFYQGQINDLSYLKANAWHSQPDPTEIDFVKVTEAPQPRPPVNGKPATVSGHPSYQGGFVVIVFNFTTSSLLDQTGKVVKTYAARGQIAYSWSLAQGNDGRWRIADERQLNPPGGIAALEKT